MEEQQLSIVFIQKPQRRIVKDLDISRGIRTVKLAPSHTGLKLAWSHTRTICMCFPDKIQSRLSVLLHYFFLNKAMVTTTTGSIQERIQLVSLFFCEFLRIPHLLAETVVPLDSCSAGPCALIVIPVFLSRDNHIVAVAHDKRNARATLFTSL